MEARSAPFPDEAGSYYHVDKGFLSGKSIDMEARFAPSPDRVVKYYHINEGFLSKKGIQVDIKIVLLLSGEVWHEYAYETFRLGCMFVAFVACASDTTSANN